MRSEAVSIPVDVEQVLRRARLRTVQSCFEDDIEVLAKCETLTQAGMLHSQWYGVTLHVPAAQSISVKILPAIDLIGQTTSDGSVLLPPIIHCTGTPVGALTLSMKVYDTDTCVDGLHYWYRNDADDEWQRHAASELHYDDVTKTGSLTADITHFTEYALACTPSDGKSYLQRKVADVVLVKDAAFKPSLLKPTHPFTDRKFIGNVTDRQLFAVARPASDTSTTNVKDSTGSVVPKIPGFSLFSFGTTRGRTENTKPHPNYHEYELEAWLPSSSTTTTTATTITTAAPAATVPQTQAQLTQTVSQPEKFPIEEVTEGNRHTQAQVAFYSVVDEYTAPPPAAATNTSAAVNSCRWSIWSSQTAAAVSAPQAQLVPVTVQQQLLIWNSWPLKAGQILIMLPNLLRRGRPACGVHELAPVGENSGRVQVVFSAMKWQ
jgi:hypothetical protein